MKVLLVGATGHVGGLTIKALLNDGHEVTAFGRSTDRIDDRDEGLTIVKGDVTSVGDVNGAVPRHDAVVLTFGAPLTFDNITSQPDLCEVGTRNVVDAMASAGVPRLIAMTSIGAGESEGHGRWVFRNIIEPGLLGRIMKDRTAQENVVREGRTREWVIVRPAELADGAAAPVERIADIERVSKEPSTVTRASVARVLSELVTDHSFDGQAIVLTNRP